MGAVDISRVACDLRCAIDSIGDNKWFLCFGTLLFFVRTGHALNLDSDLDVGIIDQGEPINTGLVTVVPGWEYHGNIHGVSLDVFVWRRRGSYYYHSHVANEFKGTPVECFDVSPKEIQYYRGDPTWGNMTHHGTWLHTVKGCEADCIQLPIPFAYGRCLDTWYPDWGVKRDQFGVSKAAHEIRGPW
jgi:hypothetical protein